MSEALSDAYDTRYLSTKESGEVVINKIKKKKLSKCCKAETFVGGEGMTHYYVCKKCGKACDIL